MVITGSRTGIGLLLARHYAAAGFFVLGCSRSPSDESFANYEHAQADVSDEADARALFRRASRLGTLQALLNNAGVGNAGHALLTPVALVKEMLETTVLGTFLCCREAAKLMRRDGGRIVNLSSEHVRLATPGTSVYGAAKAAVEQFTRVFAQEVEPFRITANCLALPYVRGTGMADRFPPDDRSPIRQVEIEEVIASLDSLIGAAAGPAARSVTGTTLFVGEPG